MKCCAMVVNRYVLRCFRKNKTSKVSSGSSGSNFEDVSVRAIGEATPVSGRGAPEVFDPIIPPSTKHLHVSAFKGKRGGLPPRFPISFERPPVEQIVAEPPTFLTQLSGDDGSCEALPSLGSRTFTPTPIHRKDEKGYTPSPLSK